MHDLRHTYACRLRAVGVSAEDRAALLGHATQSMVGHYASADVGRPLLHALRSVCSNDALLVQSCSAMESAVIEAPVPGDTFQHFIEFLRETDEPGPVLSPRRFSQAMHIDLQTLAEQAHVHRNTISRAPASRGVQDFLRQAVRVIKAATDLNGNLHRALFWYRNEPLSAFGYRTPEQLVSEGRTDDLLRYVASLEAGAAG